MTGVLGATALQALTVALSDLLASMGRLGDPARLAGDPAILRETANSHRRTAATLRTVRTGGCNAVLRVTQTGAWEGRASSSFDRYWTGFEVRLEDLASRHDQTAATLDGIATKAARLNADVLLLRDAIRRWLSCAEHSALNTPTGDIGRLMSDGQLLLEDWQRILTDAKTFAETLTQRLSQDLGFMAPRVGVVDTVPLRDAPLDINRAPSIADSRPGRLRPGPERLPPGSGLGKPGAIPPIVGGKPRYPPGPGPGPRRPRPPRPDVPPTIGPGVAPAPQLPPHGRGRERSPGEKGIPVVGQPPSVHPPPHGTAAGPAGAGPVEAPILQVTALVAAIIRARQQGKSGSAKQGGKGGGPKK